MSCGVVILFLMMVVVGGGVMVLIGRAPTHDRVNRGGIEERKRDGGFLRRVVMVRRRMCVG